MKKGRGVSVKLHGIHKVRAKGRTYFYAWRGGPRLPGDPATDAEAAKAYYDLVTPKSDTISTLFGALVARFQDAPEHTGRSKRWRQECEKIHSLLMDEFGEDDMGVFEDKRTRKDIKAIRNSYAEQPRKADKIVSELRIILNWAVDEGELTHHVCSGIKGLYSVDRSEIVWAESEIDSVCTFLTPEVGRIVKLAAYTGLDLGDLCELKWGHIKNGYIIKKREKNLHRKEPTVAAIPVIREIDEILAKCHRSSINFVVLDKLKIISIFILQGRYTRRAIAHKADETPIMLCIFVARWNWPHSDLVPM